jgi:stringent starvation protein B
MAFPVPTEASAGMTPAPTPEPLGSKGPKLALADTAKSDGAEGIEPEGGDVDTQPNEPPPEPPAGGRPTLKRIK